MKDNLNDDPIRNTSANPHFSDILEARLSRRSLLQGGMGLAALSFFGLNAVPIRFAKAARLRRSPPPIPCWVLPASRLPLPIPCK